MNGARLRLALACLSCCLILFPAVPGAGAAAPDHPLLSAAGGPGRLHPDLIRSSGPVRDDGSAGLQRERLAGSKAPGSLHAIVLMCDFADSLMLGRYGEVPGDFPPPMQTEIYYRAHDRLYFENLLADVARYFRAVSNDAFEFRFTVHPQTVNLPEPMAYYGDDPAEGERPLLLATDVVAALDDQIDFSAYDTVLLIHAGAGEETDILSDSPEQIYSTYLDPGDLAEAVEDGQLEVPYLAGGDFAGDRGIDHVLVLPETEYQDPVAGYGGYFGSLGVYCFEVGLRLGMLSLSDFTPAGRPDSQGIGEFGLMGYGLFVGLGWIPPHPCAFNKVLMGWLQPADLDPFVYGKHALVPVEGGSGPLAAARVDITGQEYWLLEYRLQDPDGNGIFSFAGDLNGNGVPDFWDASNPPSHVPADFFDAAEDTVEALTGAEWDFFMSENSARGRFEKGAGSGVYLWHVDEGVIRDVFSASGNLFNADARHKAVDLEEADGIQDLDSNIPSEFILGGDDDSFRAEGADRFGPTTRPDTETAGGAFTGIAFTDFSDVVLDPRVAILQVDGADTLWAKEYADTMSFFLSTGAVGGGDGRVPSARLTLPEGVDLRGSDVLIGDLDGGGTPAEIILTGAAGEIYVLDGDLQEYLDHDGDPATIEPFAVGTFQGEAVHWNPPAALGDFDGDGEPEILLTSDIGIFAFGADGQGLIDHGPDARGLLRALPGCDQPAVLRPRTGDGGANLPATQVDVVAITYLDGDANFHVISQAGPLEVGTIPLGRGRVTAPPVMIEPGAFAVVQAGSESSPHPKLVICLPDLQDDGGQTLTDPFRSVALAADPAAVRPTYGILRDAGLDSEVRWVMVPEAAGGGETIFLDTDLQPTAANIPWSGGITVGGPLAVGGAFVGDGFLGRLGHAGDWLDGWPRQIGQTSGTAAAAGPLTAVLAGSGLPLQQYLFPVADGRILALGTMGEEIPGWPLAGPGSCAGTPALGDLGGGESLDLVAIGTFDRITGLTDPDQQLDGVPLSTVMVWRDVAEPGGAAWPMAGGGIWRNGAYDATGWVSLPITAAGTGLVSGSHMTYPSPLSEGPLFVRGLVRAPGRARVDIYDLEGEVVAVVPWRQVSAGDPFTLEVSLDGAATGLYLCRLSVDTAGVVEHSLVQFAVVR